jgi:hypothetical protein
MSSELIIRDPAGCGATRVWYAIPTANLAQAGETFAKWRGMGYATAAFVDGPAEGSVRGIVAPAIANCNAVLRGKWLGYPAAVNALCAAILAEFPACRWIVTGGDDIDPDPNKHAERIAGECQEHFRGRRGGAGALGVMQPCGDDWMPDASGKPASARICGSPWMGREFIERFNGGNGPFRPEYYHFFCDEELKEASELARLLWQRYDLKHLHRHWSRQGQTRPAYLERAKDMWATDEAVFRKRKAAGFEGSGLKELIIDNGQLTVAKAEIAQVAGKVE